MRVSGLQGAQSPQTVNCYIASDFCGIKVQLLGVPLLHSSVLALSFQMKLMDALLS